MLLTVQVYQTQYLFCKGNKASVKYEQQRDRLVLSVNYSQINLFLC
jgi:hypothetical protein